METCGKIIALYSFKIWYCKFYQGHQTDIGGIMLKQRQTFEKGLYKFLIPRGGVFDFANNSDWNDFVF